LAVGQHRRFLPRTSTVHIAVITCLWPDSVRYTPGAGRAGPRPAAPGPYDIALVSTDLTTIPEQSTS
jgi:hypothetical protein